MLYCETTQRRYGTTNGWWPCEMVVLHSMQKDGYTYAQMAAVLDRSYGSVIGRIRHEQSKGSNDE